MNEGKENEEGAKDGEKEEEAPPTLSGLWL